MSPQALCEATPGPEEPLKHQGHEGPPGITENIWASPPTAQTTRHGCREQGHGEHHSEASLSPPAAAGNKQELPVRLTQLTRRTETAGGGGQRTEDGQTPGALSHSFQRSEVSTQKGKQTLTHTQEFGSRPVCGIFSDHIQLTAMSEKSRLRACRRGQRPGATPQEDPQDVQPAHVPGWLCRDELTRSSGPTVRQSTCASPERHPRAKKHHGGDGASSW